MGTITSGVGLSSGLNIQELVGKLIELESGASKQLQRQIDDNTLLKGSLQTVSLRIVSANLSASKLGKGGAFSVRSASATSEAVTVSAGRGAPLGTFQFTPRRLVGTSQLLSKGFDSESASITSTNTTVKISQGGFVDEGTNLSTLNGGTGVRVGSIRIVDSAGGSAVVDLTGSVTTKDVVEAINSATGINVSARAAEDRLLLTDNSGGAGTLQVTDIAGGKAAVDLGLSSLTRVANNYIGQDVYSLGSGLALAQLRDGNGVRTITGNDFTITAGSLSFSVDVDNAKTVGELLSTINNNAGNTGGRILASIDGDRLRIVDTLATDNVSVTALGGSKSASDLGLLTNSGLGTTLTGDDILGGLDTVLLTTLRGGSQTATATPGTISINGNNVNLSNAKTLQDVVDSISFAGITGVSAAVNQAGNGISIRAVGAGGLTVTNVSGNLATFLNIAGTATGSDATINSGDLNRQYVNESSRLASYGSAAGVPKGKFRITDGNGASATVDLTQDADDTIGDVIKEINTRGLAVAARINDTGDGIVIEKTAGSGAISIAEVDGGSTASALRLLRTPNGSGAIDGSLETSITINAGTTLTQFTQKLKEAGAPLQAVVINDGSPLNPFRLSLTSSRSGSQGRLLVDAGAANLTFSTTSQGQDAVLLYGASGAGVTPVQVVSSTNTFNGLVPGVQVTAKETSATPVSVSITEDKQGVVDAAQGFVDAYNEIKTYFEENARFNTESNERGILFTDNTARRIERQLASFVSSRIQVTGSSIRSLGEIGIKLDSDGRLELDKDRLEDALADSADEVERFFTTTTTGVVARFQSFTDAITGPATGALPRRTTVITQTIERQNSALTTKNARLKAREEILYQQFYSMERALSAFQGQQQTLTQLSSLANSFRSR
jgi:flagellar hook-associated protein 2